MKAGAEAIDRRTCDRRRGTAVATCGLVLALAPGCERERSRYTHIVQSAAMDEGAETGRGATISRLSVDQIKTVAEAVVPGKSATLFSQRHERLSLGAPVFPSREEGPNTAFPFSLVAFAAQAGEQGLCDGFIKKLSLPPGGGSTTEDRRRSLTRLATQLWGEPPVEEDLGALERLLTLQPPSGVDPLVLACAAMFRDLRTLTY